jgi:hypothetical protein
LLARKRGALKSPQTHTKMPAWLHQQMLPPSWNHRAVVPPAVVQHAMVSLSCTRQSGVIDVRYNSKVALTGFKVRQSGVIDVRYNSKVALTGFKVSVSQRIYCTYHANFDCFSKFTAVEPDLKSPVSISAPCGGFSHAPNFHLAVYGSNVMGVGISRRFYNFLNKDELFWTRRIVAHLRKFYVVTHKRGECTTGAVA